MDFRFNVLDLSRGSGRGQALGSFCSAAPPPSYRVHMESGFVYSPPQPTLQPSKTEVCSFTKDDNTASGAVGVVTFNLFHARKRKTLCTIAVMFSVPFDYNFYENWQAVGIFDSPLSCDKKLFDLMYEGKDFTNFKRGKGDGSGLLHQGQSVQVRSCMSAEGRATMKLEVFEAW